MPLRNNLQIWAIVGWIQWSNYMYYSLKGAPCAIEIICRLATLGIGILLNMYTFNDTSLTFESQSMAIISLSCLIVSFILTTCKVVVVITTGKKMENGVKICESFFNLYGGCILLLYGFYYLLSFKTTGESMEETRTWTGIYGILCGFSHLLLGSIVGLSYLGLTKWTTWINVTEV